MTEVPTKTLLRDEQGGVSMARTLLMCQLVYVDIMAILAAFTTLSLSPEWWAYNGTLTVGLVAWAAGPRGLQYLGPQIGNAGRNIVDAAKARLVRTDNRYKDDERGDA